jgi:hypothetical protein
MIPVRPAAQILAARAVDAIGMASRLKRSSFYSNDRYALGRSYGSSAGLNFAKASASVRFSVWLAKS